MDKDIGIAFPYYLTEDKKQGILKELKNYPDKMNYYASQEENAGFLQGDGVKNLQMIEIKNSEKKQVRGIILSNSCDICPENPRAVPPSLLFAPIIKLSSYIDVLGQNGQTSTQIESQERDIRAQKITSLFFLPKFSSSADDAIVMFDKIQSIPFDYFEQLEGKELMFRLSQVGFYMFLFKLSVHFCRFHENVLRS